MAVSDIQPVRCGDSGADIGLGVANGTLKAMPLGKTRRDGRRQRASGAVGIGGRDARRSEPDHGIRVDQIIRALRPVSMTTLDQNRGTAEGEQSPALLFDSLLAFGNALIEQRSRLRQVRRDQVRAWKEFGAQRIDRIR